ncbi:MAG: M15 family metallopeptidase [Lachnospiraceae bacterium]|nr:M15 family metallopeptidase [Lachnospiraceae bacterium]
MEHREHEDVTAFSYKDETNLLLVNKEKVLPEDYDVSIVSLNNGQQVAADIYDDLRDMLFTGEEEEGLSFLVASGYRTKEKQMQLVEEEIIKNQSFGMTYEEAYEDAMLTVAPTGYSEHETGLAVDIVAVANQRLDETQEYTRENQWLRENCYKYGFILRYPKDKEDITGFSYESWHFRYVGKEAAKEITEKGITLEEYLEGG